MEEKNISKQDLRDANAELKISKDNISASVIGETVTIATKYDFIELDVQDVPELISVLSAVQGSAAMKTEPKAISNELDELFHYLDKLYGYGGDGIGCIVGCMGNLISNNVILDRIANGKTSDYAGSGNVDDNVCSGNIILHEIIEVLMAYRRIKY